MVKHKNDPAIQALLDRDMENARKTAHNMTRGEKRFWIITVLFAFVGFVSGMYFFDSIGWGIGSALSFFTIGMVLQYYFFDPHA